MKKIVPVLTLLIIFLTAQATAFEFCDDGTIGGKNLRIISLDDMLKINLQEWVWESPEEIELEIRVENKEDETNNYILELIFLDDNDDEIDLAENEDNLKQEISLSAKERQSISFNFQIDDKIEIGNYNLYAKFYEKSNEDERCVETKIEQIEIEKIEICENGIVDEDELEIKSISDENSDNENDWEWSPANEIEISVDVSNKDYSSRDFTTELVLIDENGNEISFAKDNENLREEISLDEGENDDLTFTFEIQNGMEEGDYSLYAKFFDSDDEDTCTSLKAQTKSDPKRITIKKEDHNSIITNVNGPANAKINENLEYSITVTNLGIEDEEKVAVLVYNHQLELRQIIEVEDLSSGESREATLNFEIPENASLSEYKLTFSTRFEYDKRVNNYRDESNEDDDIKYTLTIAEGEVQPEEIINETITNETETNETIVQIEQNETDEFLQTDSIMTGAATGDSGQETSWITVIVGIIAVAGVGMFLFARKKKKQPSQEYVEVPSTPRRYSASLD